MAEAKTPPAEAPAPTGRRRGPLVAVLVLVLLGGAGGAAYQMGYLDPWLGTETDEEPALPAPIYVKLEKAFVVNLADTDAQRFLQAEINLMTRHAELPAQIEAHAPAIEHAVVLQLSGLHFAELKAPAGKEQVLTDLRERLNRLLLERTQIENAIEEVYFPSFVMQ